MSQLRTYLEDYIQDLQTLKAQYSNNQDLLLDTAEDKWGDEDPRFMILQERPKQQRWISPSGQPSVPKSAADAPNELINWLPGYLETLQGLLKAAADDNALVEEAAKKWGKGSYGHQVVKQGSKS